jgi:hypothetical protein
MAPRRPKSLESGRQNFFLTHGGKPLPLGPKVVETLLALVECNGGVASKARLLDRIWPEGYVGESNLAQNIAAHPLSRDCGSSGRCDCRGARIDGSRGLRRPSNDQQHMERGVGALVRHRPLLLGYAIA